MKNTFSTGASGTRDARADDNRPEPQRGPDRPARRARLLDFLTRRNFGVRFTLSRAKRRAHGGTHGFGPIKSIAAL